MSPTAVPPPSTEPARRRWPRAGVMLLLIAACAYGVLEVHYSADTWIALAAGRQIVSAPSFPKADTFSYTFAGATWFNQNWLSDVLLWLLYDKLGPDAVAIGNWVVGVASFMLVLAATWVRTGSGLAAALAAAVVAIATRDWLRIRPATIQLFLLAALWLVLAVAIGGRPSAPSLRGRGMAHWVALALVFPLLATWTQAHGSFAFGFALVGMLLACTALARLLGRPTALSGPQALVLLGITLAAAVLGAVLSPYGLENYTHPLKVVESDVFREVGEWVPPFRPGKLPPVGRFWAFVVLAAALPFATLLLRIWHHEPRRAGPKCASVQDVPTRLDVLILDVAAVGLGLAMALFARRFAPIFYILATPALVAAILHLAQPLSATLRRRLQSLLVWAAWPVGIATGCVAAYAAHQDLIARFPPGSAYSLLDRVTRNDTTPLDILQFLQRNTAAAHVLADWKLGGLIMFYAPSAKVFIDGRAQQVYSEPHVRLYRWLTSVKPAERTQVAEVLTQSGTDAILLTSWATTKPLALALADDPRWRCIYAAPKAWLLVRRDSALLADLRRRERGGELWWPNVPEAQASRTALREDE